MVGYENKIKASLLALPNLAKTSAHQFASL